MQTNKTRSATPLDECRVYVGTYGKYNNGSIFGKWVELSDFDSQEDFYNFCKEIHADEEDAEFMFQDYETPEILKDLISESHIDENIFEIAREHFRYLFNICINITYLLHRINLKHLKTLKNETKK